MGAVVAQVGFGKLVNIGGPNAFVPHLYASCCFPECSLVTDLCPARLEIFAFFMLTGVLSTLVLKEGKQLTLETLSNEEQDAFIDGDHFHMLSAVPCTEPKLIPAW